MKFLLYKEEALKFLEAAHEGEKNPIISFNIDSLEEEYDYATDEEQIIRAKQVAINESYEAIEFAVKEPINALIMNLGAD